MFREHVVARPALRLSPRRAEAHLIPVLRHAHQQQSGGADAQLPVGVSEAVAEAPKALHALGVPRLPCGDDYLSALRQFITCVGVEVRLAARLDPVSPGVVSAEARALQPRTHGYDHAVDDEVAADDAPGAASYVLRHCLEIVGAPKREDLGFS